MDEDVALARSIQILLAQQRQFLNEQRNMDILRQEQAASDRLRTSGPTADALFERFLRESVALWTNRPGNTALPN